MATIRALRPGGGPPCQSPPFPSLLHSSLRVRVLNRAHRLTFKQVDDLVRGYEKSDKTAPDAHSLDHLCSEVPIVSPLYSSSSSSSSFLDQAFSLHRIGHGSFGEVFRARSLEDGRDYAVKWFIDCFSSSMHRASVLKEVKRLEDLSPHPNIIHFVSAWEERGRLHIQTEFYPHSLSEYTASFFHSNPSSPSLPLDETWNIFFDLVNALSFLHSHSILHLDVKPDNVLLSAEKVCKLADFGLSLDTRTDLLSFDRKYGDYRYVDEETLSGRPSTATDIFALGVTMVEAATDMEIPKGGDKWRLLRQGILPERFRKALDPLLLSLVVSMLSPVSSSRPSAASLSSHPSVSSSMTRRMQETLSLPPYLHGKSSFSSHPVSPSPSPSPFISTKDVGEVDGIFYYPRGLRCKRRLFRREGKSPHESPAKRRPVLRFSLDEDFP